MTHETSLYFCWQRRENIVGRERGEGRAEQSQPKVLCKMEVCGLGVGALLIYSRLRAQSL